MLTCRKCLNNSFSWSKGDDGEKIAICQMCGQEIIFSPKIIVEKEGDKCRKCGTPVILKESKFRKDKLKKPYYYTAYYLCPDCKKMYLSDKFKVITDVRAEFPDGCRMNNQGLLEII